MMDSQNLGKLLIFLGVLTFAAGILLYFNRFPDFLGRLPGDIRIERPGFNFYFPITTSILLSIIFSLVLYFLSKFR